MSPVRLDEIDVQEVFADGVPFDDPFTLLALAQLSVERLRHANTDMLDRAEFGHFARGVEQLRNQTDAAAVDAATCATDRGHDRDHGFFSGRAWIRHHANLSNQEARARMQVVRLFELLPEWERAARNGLVGVEQVRLVARTAAIPAVVDAIVDQSSNLLDDAITCPFDLFEERVANLRKLADAEGSARDAQRRHEARDVSFRRLDDGSWRLSGRFGGMQGAELNHILAHFIDAEWRADWVDAAERLGADAPIGLTDLRRSEPQRRADAFFHAMLAAAAAPGPGKQPLPTLGVLFDAESLETTLLGGEHDPARYREIVCRTQNGDSLDFSEAAQLALFAHLRRVVVDGRGVVIEQGRRQRLFRGAAREATLMMQTTCVWFGCDAPVRRVHADHNVEWLRHGGTDPDNGGGLCAGHNLLKERGKFRVFRDDDGDWTITDADGKPVG